jgi:hypothetical protein
MSHLFVLFSGHVLRPPSVAIGNGTILFEISFKFFFAHTELPSAIYGTVEAKAEGVVTFLGRQKERTCEFRGLKQTGRIAPSLMPRFHRPSRKSKTPDSQNTGASGVIF